MNALKFGFTAKRIEMIEAATSVAINVDVEMSEHMARGMLEELAVAISKEKLLEWVGAIP